MATLENGSRKTSFSWDFVVVSGRKVAKCNRLRNVIGSEIWTHWSHARVFLTTLLLPSIATCAGWNSKCRCHRWKNWKTPACIREIQVDKLHLASQCAFGNDMCRLVVQEFFNLFASFKQQQNLMKIMFSSIHFPIWPYPPKIMKNNVFYTSKLYGLTDMRSKHMLVFKSIQVYVDSHAVHLNHTSLSQQTQENCGREKWAKASPIVITRKLWGL